ncbi:biotinidase [Betta splendens]|uniref:Biotinidase n=1 Tax=Betta splendens TaxID=158456 RepID=A0A6P7P028_BETSP|nr:biotinidase [Betta splendens]XP_055369048.1 biotinidase [Betta splendens]
MTVQPTQSLGGDAVLWILASVFSAAAQTSGQSSYVAAVYEHRLIWNPEPRVPLSRTAALRHVQQNLDVYEKQAALAAEQNAQILVFPEDGLQGINFSRSSIYSYLETIPDPQQDTWNPCTEPDKHNNTEVLQRLSCIARRHNLYVVANMADLQPCSPGNEPASCPPDGRWQFNTNVVFSSSGQLVARYHKYNTYFEEAFDSPQPELVTFDTPFAGRFGLIICFDILFHVPTVALIEQGVRQLIFTAAWYPNQLPLLAAIQVQQAFSLGSNVTLLAANIRSDPLVTSGSGIFTPSSATYHHARKGDPERGRLLVARVPVLEPLWTGRRVDTESRDESSPFKAADSGHCHQDNQLDSYCTKPPSAEAPASVSSTTFVSAMMYDPFTFVLLNDTEGSLRVCDGAFCCYLWYRRFPPATDGELYALGAFAGTHTKNGRYALQVCALVRCAGSDAGSCGKEVEEAETKMDFLLEGKFGTRYVYPSVLVSQMVLEQPEHLEKTGDGRVTMKHSNTAGGLVTACLYGRMYHLDNEGTSTQGADGLRHGSFEPEVTAEDILPLHQ